MNNETALSDNTTTVAQVNVRPATPGQMKDIYSLVIQAIPELTFEQATLILRNKKAQIGLIADTFPGHEDGINQVKTWIYFYKQVFRMDVGDQLTQVILPQRRPGFDRLIVIPRGLKLNLTYDVCLRHFPCWRYVDDLDAAITQNDRTPTEAYAIYLRERLEADEELKNKSADDLDGIFKGITLLERMVFELKYFLETGKHLDVQSTTLCTGSRYDNGLVADARWCGGKFSVDWCPPSCIDPVGRSREVVTL